MKLLLIDTSGALCSAAVAEGETILSECCTNNGLTHSATLMERIDGVLKAASATLTDMDAFAVTAGPGSFTGLRIGLSTAKAFSQVTGKPVLALSTLSLLAENFLGLYDAVCPVMDARAGRVYTALFRRGTRVEPDGVMELADLSSFIGAEERVLFTGDGVDQYAPALKILFPNAVFAPGNMRYQKASFGAGLALRDYEKGLVYDAKSLRVNYLVKSQAERNDEKNRSGNA